MEEKTTEKVRRTTSRIGGVSIAWVTLFGALCGVTGLVPIFPSAPLPRCCWGRWAGLSLRPSAGSSGW